MSICKSCGQIGGYHKPWCMRRQPMQPAKVHEVRAAFIRACA